MHGTKGNKLSAATLQMQTLPGAFRQPACRQARQFAHTPLHVSHANQRSNNKRNGEDPSPAAAVNTLSLLELLLTQPKLDTDTASETSLLVDDTSAMPDSSLADAHLTTPGISHQLPTPSDIWTQTWQPVEPSSPVHAKQAQAAAASQLQMPVALPSLRFWRQQQQQQQLPGHSSQKARDKSVLQQHEKGLAAATMMRNAQMQLQGIEPAARLQLMALCMASLEDLTESLKGVSIRLTKQEWIQVCPAVLAVCSVQAGTSWLGYCPRELLHQARQVVSHLSRVSDSSTSYSVAHSHLRLALQSAAATSPLPAFEIPSEASQATAMQSTVDAASSSQQDSASYEVTAANSSNSAWQSAEENVVLHATVLRHMCQHSSDESSQSQPGADTDNPSSSTGHAQTQLAYPKGSHRSTTQSLRSTAHQTIAGKSKPVNSLPSQNTARQQRELAALQVTLQSAPAVLQDMASHAAEAVAMCYLAEARSGLSGGSPGEDWWPLHLHPQLRSTRGLERFRNQVSLNRLVHHNFHSVANIYEDKHQLCGFGARAELLQRNVHARRVKELESLKGWKYIVSLLLEAGDIALPIFKNCMARVSAAISWLLVTLIGRALGLIYRGVKQSLVPQRQKQRKGQTASTDTGPQAWMPKLS